MSPGYRDLRAEVNAGALLAEPGLLHCKTNFFRGKSPEGPLPFDLFVILA
jgi:hypothetical protein